MTPNQFAETMLRAGWRWTDQHLILTVEFGGNWYRVALPVQRVERAVLRELPASVGAEWGEPSTSCVGFWKSFTRRLKKAVRPLVPKAVRRATARLERQAHRALQKAIPIGRSILKSKVLTGVLAAASFVPGAAAITVPALAAQQAAIQAIRMAEQGYEAAKLIERGVRDPRLGALRRRGLDALRSIEVTAAAAKRGNRAALERTAAIQQLIGRG